LNQKLQEKIFEKKGEIDFLLFFPFKNLFLQKNHEMRRCFSESSFLAEFLLKKKMLRNFSCENFSVCKVKKIPLKNREKKISLNYSYSSKR